MFSRLCINRSYATLVSCAFLAMGTVSSFGGALIYYDGSGNGTSVTNLGSLGELGNGVIQTAGTGAVSFADVGGAQGTEDPFFNLSNSASNGARISVPTAGLPNLHNSSWSISGWFKRTSNTTSDTILHFGSGDNFGMEEELYLVGGQNSTNVNLQNYDPVDVNLQASLSLNTWHFFAITFAASGANDGKGTLKLYFNGNAPLTDSELTLQFSSVLNLGGIGYAPNVTSADRDFLGGLDEFAFYDQVLDAPQVTGLYNRTLDPTSVPEPATAVTLLAGLALLVPLRRQKR